MRGLKTALVASATAPAAVIVPLTSLAIPIAIPAAPRVASAGIDSGIGEGRGCAAIEAATAAIIAAAAAAIGEATATAAATIREATTTTAIKAPGCTLYAFRAGRRTVAVEAPSRAAAATAARALLRFVDAEGAAVELLPVHRRNRRFGIGVARHFHEGEPSGTTGFPIRHDEDAGDLPPVCTE